MHFDPSIVAALLALCCSAPRSKGGGKIAPVKNPRFQARRNDLCPCGSGQKFKRCCIRKAA